MSEFAEFGATEAEVDAMMASGEAVRLRSSVQFRLLRATDDLAHHLHAPRWLQRHLCDWLDISCGITRDELRREREGRRISEAINADPSEVARLRAARQHARDARALRRRPPWADED